MTRPDFGPEYPRFVAAPGGRRLPLVRETRWSREFGDPQSVLVISRLMDGSAQLSAAELRAESSTWSPAERLDYSRSCCWSKGEPDFADQLRFIIANGSAAEWSAVALSFAGVVPTDEGFGTLNSLLDQIPPGERANILQAITRTGHPSALGVMLEEVQALLALPRVWDDDPFLNWLAHDLACAIANAVSLGAEPAQFSSAVARLATHPCQGNVDAARMRLSGAFEDTFDGGAA
jgi:hypothetical protein